VVGKDFGALPAYDFALQHPDRTAGVVCLGIPFSPVPFSFETTMPEGFYILRWGVRAASELCTNSEPGGWLVLISLCGVFCFCRSLAGRRRTSAGTM
jgi:pimeloyl-ACP methyl ester carboxylesterase